MYQYPDRCRSNLTLGLDRLFKADARVVPGSRSRLGLMFPHVCVCRQIVASTFAPSRSGIGQVARPTFSGISGRVTELRAVDEGAVPASTPMTSRLFVLPVAARRWVSTDNTSEEPIESWCQIRSVYIRIFINKANNYKAASIKSN